MSAPRGPKRRALPTEDELLARLREDLAARNLKYTRPREDIFLSFLATEGHVSAEELFDKVRERNPRIGFATVHRTLKLLVEAGYAEEHRFGGRQRRYEVAMRKDHHDHLICTGCRRIVEFEEPAIEDLQDDIARRFGFVITHHRHELFGLCEDCQGPRK